MDRLEYFSGLVAEDPREPRARYGLANELRHADRHEEAVAQWRAYLGLAPDEEGAAWGYLAESLTALGRDDEAADAYLEGIDVASRHGHHGLADDYAQAMEGLGPG